jgi:glycosyltransferase involved in cell wall biosynthesis
MVNYNNKRPAIGIFRHTLLPPSETFIAEQASHISNFDVHFFGREPGSGDFDLPNRHTIQNNNKRFIERSFYTLTGQNRRLMKKIKSVDPVLLHAHFGVEGVYALPFARQLGIPLVTTFHGFDATKRYIDLIRSGKISWYNFVIKMRMLKHQGDCFIAVSNYIRSKLIQRGFPPEKIVVHYIGIDPHRFTPDDKEDDGQTILTVGRLVEKKGTEYLLKSVHKIKQSIPDVKLNIVGDGPLRSSLEKLTYELGLSNCVIFYGALSYEKVVNIMKKATVFCLPSITASDGDAEGLGLVLLEASASGNPVIGTMHGGIPEVVCDGENGFIVPEKNVSALTDRILLLLKNPVLRREIAVKGRKWVECNFDITKQGEKLDQIYKNVINTYWMN